MRGCLNKNKQNSKYVEEFEEILPHWSFNESCTMYHVDIHLQNSGFMLLTGIKKLGLNKCLGFPSPVIQTSQYVYICLLVCQIVTFHLILIFFVMND